MIFADQARMANTLNTVDPADVIAIYTWGRILFDNEILACLLLRIDDLIRMSAVHNQTSILYLFQSLPAQDVLRVETFLIAIGYEVEIGALAIGRYWMVIS